MLGLTTELKEQISHRKEIRPSDSSTITSFSNGQRARTSGPVSFWRENKIAVVILWEFFFSGIGHIGAFCSEFVLR